MTNYPRDEFDRVPEFNTRVGSHHAHGWAQSATSKSTEGKLLWVVLAAVVVQAIRQAALAEILVCEQGLSQCMPYGPAAVVAVAGAEAHANLGNRHLQLFGSQARPAPCAPMVA